MGQLFIPGEKDIQGPWLLGPEELLQLDSIIEAIDKLLEVDAKALYDDGVKTRWQTFQSGTLEDYIEKEQRYYVPKIVKKATLISEDGRRFTDSSVAGILKYHLLKDFAPKEFAIDIERYTTQFQLSVSSNYTGKLKYSVNCYDAECRQEIVYLVDGWCDKNQPNRAKQILSNFGGLFFFLGLALIGWSVAAMIPKYEMPDMKSRYQIEINQIIKKGVTKENETKAVELLLKYESEYKPENIKPIKTENSWATQAFSLCLISMFIGLARPKTTIGLGRRRRLLTFYKWSTRAILITIPALLIYPPIMAWIRAWSHL